MILVDTSVLVDYLKGKETSKTHIFNAILNQGLSFGISPYTYQELLQGTRGDKEFTLLKEYLDTQTFYFLPPTLETFERTARLYFDLRRKGITPRGTIDVFIALTAIHHNLSLLHDDRDFDSMASAIKSLKIMTLA
jgi:predicted nucleic acid-binding protein